MSPKLLAALVLIVLALAAFAAPAPQPAAGVRATTANASAQRGLAFYPQGDLNRAIAEYSLAIMPGPDNALVVELNGAVYMEEKMIDQAIADSIFRINR